MKPPEKGTEFYKEVLEKGCGGYRDRQGDFCCEYEYEWTCDNCPNTIEHQKEKMEEI